MLEKKGCCDCQGGGAQVQGTVPCHAVISGDALAEFGRLVHQPIGQSLFVGSGELFVMVVAATARGEATATDVVG
jgi:hypothetical protein